MELITILNRCHRFRGFVYQHAHFSADKKSIEAAVLPQRGSAAGRCLKLSQSITSRTGSQIAPVPLTRCRKLPKTSSIHGSNGAQRTHFEQTCAPSLLSKLPAT